ncbi:hypothetical protein ACOSQ3_022483 [Xanthoceras sorbifolium]
MEREVMVLFSAAMNAAEAAARDGGSDNESRCIELLKSLKDFPITVNVLLSTQIDKRLRHLKKHQREKIRLMAVWLMETWSKKIKDDRSSSRNRGGKCISTTRDDLLLFSFSSSAKPKRKLEASSGMFPARKRFCDSRNIMLTQEDKKPRPRVSMEERNTTPFNCPDASRNKVREILLEALSKVAGEAIEQERVRGCDPVGVAVSVESVMFKKMGPYNGPKKLKYRSIIFNVKDPKNPDFRRKILLGDIKPELLITMTSEEMASHQRQCQNHQIKDKAFSALIKKPVNQDSLPKSDGDEAIWIESLCD